MIIAVFSVSLRNNSLIVHSNTPSVLINIIFHKMYLPVKKIFCAFSLLTLALNAGAVMATPETIFHNNPDGSKIQIRIYGDEHFSYRTTPDGYIVATDNTGRLRYMATDTEGNLRISNQTVSDISSRSDSETRFLDTIDKEQILSLTLSDAAKHSATARQTGPAYAPTNEKISSFPSKGSPRVLVVLAEYQDIRFRNGAKEQISDMLNKRGYSYNGATGSALDYFSACSDGQFTPQFDVYGPVTLGNNRVYYGEHLDDTNDLRAPEMVAEACKALDNEINFANYDCDGDGQCDNIYVFFAGQGEADSGIEESIWPHAWYLSGHRCHFIADGVLMNRYATSAELNTSGGSIYPTGIGTFVHEFSHVMGLPDLYDTNYSGSHHPGQWSLMASGSYLNRQNTPPMYSAYERAVMGWLNPTELTQPRNIELAPSTASDGFNDAYTIKTPSANEYYILENRRKTGWDSFIPSEGMLIWHIDYNASVWSRNTVNNDPDHQRIDIVESSFKSGNEGTPFPGCDNIRSFTDDTNPAITPWSGTRLNKKLEEITRFDDGVVSFRYNGGQVIESQLKLNAPTDITYQSARISWQPVDGVETYYINLWHDGQQLLSDIPTDQTAYTFSALEPKETYTYTIGYYEGRFLATAENSFTTSFSPINTRRPKAGEASDITANSAIVSWEEMEGADSYTVTLYTGTSKGAETTTLTFDDNAVTDGWFSNSTSFSSTSGYYGQKAPALQLEDKQYLNSPQFLGDITAISFIARRFGTTSSALIIEGRKSAAHPWIEIFNAEIARSKSRKTLNAETIGEGITELRFSLTATSGVRVMLDDIAVTVAESYNLTPVEGQNSRDAGNRLTYRFSNLEQLTDYFYTVTGHNGQMSSMESIPVRFTTTQEELSGIDNIDNDCSFYLNDNILYVNAGNSETSVFTPDGKTIAAGCGNLTVILPAQGLYIIRIGNKAYKVILK